MTKKLLFGLIVIIYSLSYNFVYPEEASSPPPAQEPVGEMFGMPVSAANYYFIRGVIAVFGNQWGGRPRTAEEIEDETWLQLLLSYEAFRRGVKVSDEELEREIGGMLSNERVDFDRKNDRDSYEKWVMNKTGATAELFENQLRHLIQIRKLRTQVMESIEPKVSKKEMYREFLNEHNALSLEITQFENERAAMKFFINCKKDKDYWEKEKETYPDRFKGPGSAMSLEAWIDLWKIPTKDCYRMLKLREGDFYRPTPIYKGYAVFKVHAKKIASKAAFPERETSYYEQVLQNKRFEGYNSWLEDLKKRANIVKYTSFPVVSE